MTPPTDFTRRLHREFDGRLRLRWSPTSEAWHIEQKVGRAQGCPARVVNPYDDRRVRARDGYAYVMTIRPGDRMPCPACKRTLPVPVRRFAEVRCPGCLRDGRDRSLVASYWPLGGGLLEALRRIDPLRDGPQRMAREADRLNARMQASRERQTRNEGEALLKDHINQIGGFTTVGYTGREQPLDPTVPF